MGFYFCPHYYVQVQTWGDKDAKNDQMKLHRWTNAFQRLFCYGLPQPFLYIHWKDTRIKSWIITHLYYLTELLYQFIDNCTLSASKKSGLFCGKYILWQYRLWNFQTRGTKLERFLPKNQHPWRKLLNFENWVSGEVSKSAKSPNLLTFKVNFLFQKLSESFSIFFSLKNINF